MLSGIGAPEVAFRLLCGAAEGLTHRCVLACELDRNFHKFLGTWGEPVHLVPNLRDMFSSTFLTGADAVSGSLARLQVYMADNTPEVIVDRDTPTAKILGPGDLGDVHVAGSPCVDFSPFGRRRGCTGPSMILFMLWSAMIKTCLPCCVFYENVVQFPVQVLIHVLGHLYCVSTILVDAATWMGAVRRKRRHAVLTRRGHAHLRRPLSEFGNWHIGTVCSSCRWTHAVLLVPGSRRGRSWLLTTVPGMQHAISGRALSIP